MKLKIRLISFVIYLASALPTISYGESLMPAELFAKAITQTQEKLAQDPYTNSSPHAQSVTSDFVAGLIGSAWRLSHYARHLNAPRFSGSDEFIGLPGLFNPDNIYRNALLDDTASYRISGERGSHVQLTFQFIDSFPLIGLSKDLLVINLDKLGVKPGDRFEFFLGGPKRQGLWWPMPKGAKTVLARQTFNDWAVETHTTLNIERLHATQNIPAGPKRLVLAADYLQKVTDLWTDSYMKDLRRLPINSIPPMRASKERDGGLSGQHTAIARFKLDEGESLLITSKPSDAAYQAIQIGNYWFATPNPVMYQSSLNMSQAYINKDGLLRYVISNEDPGIVNWLNSAGANQGYILLRWQGIRSPLTAADQPTAKRVLSKELRQYLPDDSLEFDAHQRDQQMRLRANYPALANTP